jgi:hypothetical protein
VRSINFNDAGDFCRIEVARDDILQDISMTFSRGLNVVVLDYIDGNVVETAVFDTHISSMESDSFTRFVDSLESGSIIILLCKDDCTENLTESAKLVSCFA